MSRRSKMKIVLAVLSALMIICVVGAGVYMYEKTSSREKSIHTGTEKIGRIRFGKEEYETENNIQSYLFMGTDGSGNENGKGDKYRGSMSDFILLVILDKTENTYGFIQLNRDIITEIPMMDSDGEVNVTGKAQLCTAHWYGGNRNQSCENTVETVSKLLGGIDIDGYYAMGMKEIGRLNNAVGGVPVEIEDDLTSVDPSLKKGRHIKLNDAQAENFLRARTGVGDEENISRMRRQEQYLKALMDIFRKKIRRDPKFSDSIYRKMKRYAVTDMFGNAISNISNAIYRGENKGILQFKGTRKTGKTLDDGLLHSEFYPSRKSIIDVMTRLYSLKKIEKRERD